ncbi:MAG: hypothetical protein Q8P59_04285 [Dehalococcoidia bacterium]|nr:hypothetical protein [Dehalococcoidia bacterium]
MIERKVRSWDAVLAIREAEEIISQKAGGTGKSTPAVGLVRALGRGLLAAGFLALCFLPAITVLALVALAIILAR